VRIIILGGMGDGRIGAAMTKQVNGEVLMWRAGADVKLQEGKV
jgi:hypothetical protein